MAGGMLNALSSGREATARRHLCRQRQRRHTLIAIDGMAGYPNMGELIKPP